MALQLSCASSISRGLGSTTAPLVGQAGGSAVPTMSRVPSRAGLPLAPDKEGEREAYGHPGRRELSQPGGRRYVHRSAANCGSFEALTTSEIVERAGRLLRDVSSPKHDLHDVPWAVEFRYEDILDERLDRAAAHRAVADLREWVDGLLDAPDDVTGSDRRVRRSRRR